MARVSDIHRIQRTPLVSEDGQGRGSAVADRRDIRSCWKWFGADTNPILRCFGRARRRRLERRKGARPTAIQRTRLIPYRQTSDNSLRSASLRAPRTVYNCTYYRLTEGKVNRFPKSARLSVYVIIRPRNTPRDSSQEGTKSYDSRLQLSRTISLASTTNHLRQRHACELPLVPKEPPTRSTRMPNGVWIADGSSRPPRQLRFPGRPLEGRSTLISWLPAPS